MNSNSIASTIGISMPYTYKGSSHWGNGAREWRVTLKGPGGKATFPYHTGAAHSEPDMDDVVWTLLRESCDAEQYEDDWREFASDFGYDTEEDNGKECRRLLKLMSKNADKMNRILPGHDFAELLNTIYQDY